MRRLIRSEAIKLTTTRTLLGMVLGAAAVAGLGAASVVLAAERDVLDRALQDQDFYVLASINITLFALVLGIRGLTDEFRHGVIRPTVLAIPTRHRIVVAKAATYLAAGATVAVGAQVVLLAVAAVAAMTRGATLQLGAGDLGALAGLAAASGLWAVIGLALGAIIRHQVAAIVAALLWVLLLENLGAGLLGDAGRFLPGQAAHALAQATGAGVLLAPAAGGTVLAAYVATAAVGATIALRRVDL